MIKLVKTFVYISTFIYSLNCYAKYEKYIDRSSNFTKLGSKEYLKYKTNMIENTSFKVYLDKLERENISRESGEQELIKFIDNNHSSIITESGYKAYREGSQQKIYENFKLMPENLTHPLKNNPKQVSLINLDPLELNNVELKKTILKPLSKTNNKSPFDLNNNKYSIINKKMLGNKKNYILAKDNLYMSKILDRKNQLKVINSFIEKIEDKGICLYPGLINYDKDKHNIKNISQFRMCMIKDITFPIPDIPTIASILCENIVENTDKKSMHFCKEIESSNKETIITPLKESLPKLTVTTFQQEYKIDSKFYPINDSFVTIIENEKHYVLYSNAMRNNKFELEESIKKIQSFDCVKPIEIEDSVLSIRINHYFDKKETWECQNSDSDNRSISLLKLYRNNNEEKIEKQILYPVVRKTCHVSGKEYGAHRVRIILDAINGTILDNVNELQSKVKFNKITRQSKNNVYTTKSGKTPLNTWAINNNTIEKEFTFYKKNPKINIQSKIFENLNPRLKNTYIHMDRLHSLFIATLSNDEKTNFPFSQTNLISSDNLNNKSCECDINYACRKNNNLCLLDNDKIKTSNDTTITIHEYLHILVPNFLILGCQNKNFSYCHSINANFNELFHDLADSITFLYTNSTIIGANIKSQLIKNNSKTSTRFPVTSDYSNGLLKKLPLKNDEYKQGLILARMFQIAHDLNTSKSSKVEASIKHWVRLLRAIKSTHINNILCYNCELDFLNVQQQIMTFYWAQLLNTSDQVFIQELLFNWSKEGFNSINYSCIDPLRNNNIECLDDGKDDGQTSHTNYGLAHSKIEVASDDHLIIKLNTGIKHEINHNRNLVKVNTDTKTCNKFARIIFYYCPRNKAQKTNYMNCITPEDYKQDIVNIKHDPTEIEFIDIGKNHCIGSINIYKDDVIITNTSQKPVKYSSIINKANIKDWYYKLLTHREKDTIEGSYILDNLNIAQPLINKL